MANRRRSTDNKPKFKTEQLESAFKDAVKARSAPLALTQSALFDPTRKDIPDLAVKYGLPSISIQGEFVANGGADVLGS